MKTAYEKYLIHLNIKYDEKELFKEVDKLTFKEFAPTHCYFRSTWLKAARQIYQSVLAMYWYWYFS